MHGHVIVGKGNGGLMAMVSALRPWDHMFEPHAGHDHDSSYDTSTGWFQEADLLCDLNKL